MWKTSISRAVLFSLIVLLLGLHWARIGADPSPRLGFLAHDGSNDLYTDEGLDSSGAIAAARYGHWYLPGQFNLAVDAPLWSAILYIPFSVVGVSIAWARSIEVAFYAASVLLLYLFVRRWRPAPDPVALWTAVLLATNYMAFNFSRMAILESVWTCFMIAALLLLTYACERSSLLLGYLSGVCLACALLTKFTALFAVLPLGAVLLLFPRGAGRRVRLGIAATLGTATLVLPYLYELLVHYRIDHAYYQQVNIAERAVHTPFAWLYTVVKIIASVRNFDVAICLAFFIGFFVFVVGRRASQWREHPLVIVLVLWLAGNVLIASTITYFPPRYDLNPLFAFAALAVIFAEDAASRSRKLGNALYGLLALAAVIGVAEIGAGLVHARYTVQAAARSMAASGAWDPHAIVMGDCAYSLALVADLRPMNDILGVTPRPARISTASPRYLVSLGTPSEDLSADFKSAGRQLRLLRVYDVLGNYSHGRPLYFYEVEPRDTLGTRSASTVSQSPPDPSAH
jgi:4-amino-4-deoxy-L-arabinose transferase-like glycosyltransferase